MSSSSRPIVAAVLLGVLQAAAACNSVLGIDAAELYADPEAVCHAGQGATLVECPISDACESCLGDECSDQEITSCLANSECRKALTNYRTCGSDDCKDPTGTCAGCLEGGHGAGCFARCAKECLGSEIIDLCTIFCACMSANCPNRLDPATCVSNCKNTHTPWRTNCLLSHCELAPALPDHCNHAADSPVHVCPDTQINDASCTDKKLLGRGCNDKDECCSGFCRDGQCSL